MNSFKTHSVSMIQEIREEDIMSTTAAVKALEGDWQFVSEKVLLALACKVMLSTAGLGSSEGDSEAHDGQ